MDDSEYLLGDEEECESLLNDDEEISVQQGRRNCTENDIAAKHGRGCEFCRESFVTLAEVRKARILTV
jgi:hypothetical protein